MFNYRIVVAQAETLRKIFLKKNIDKDELLESPIPKYNLL